MLNKPKLYNTAEAAVYLNMALSSLKRHIEITKRIKGELIGGTLVFTQDELDRFASLRRRAGRPRKPPKRASPP